MASSLEYQFHLPVINTMIVQWPKVDLVEYNAAQAPGYHLLLAFVGVYVSDDETTLKFVSTLISLGLLLTVFHYARIYAGPWLALVFVLPLLGSRYFLESAIWLISDNTSLLFACLALGGLIFRTATPFRSLRLGLWAMLAFAVRQYYIAIVIPMGVAGLLSSRIGRGAARLLRAESTDIGPWRNRINLGASVISIAMPLVLFIALFKLWDGLVPPNFQDYHRGPNLSIIPIGVALIGIYGLFFLPLLWSQIRLLRLSDKNLWLVILGGVFISLMWPTSDSGIATGPGGVLWEVVYLTPSIWERSLILIPLTAGGSVIFFLMWRSAANAGRGYSATVLVAAVFAFLLALSANRFAHQRYVEPAVLVAVIWLASITMISTTSAVVDAGRSKLLYPGPSLLAGMQFLIALMLLYRPVAISG